MKNSADLRGCYPPWPSASVDNTLLDLQNSSYATQPHSIIANYSYMLISLLSAVPFNGLNEFNSVFRSLIWGLLLVDFLGGGSNF